MVGSENAIRFVKSLALGVFGILVLTTFAGIAFNVGGTDLDQGWAIIAAPGYDDSQHKTEAKNLRSYLLERGWDDDHIIFLGDGEASYDDGEATIENFEDAIDYVSQHSSVEDVIFISVLDHGVKGENGKHYLKFGDDLDETMSDTELDAQLDEITDFDTLVVDIAGPYSGGFIAETQADGRLIITDCSDEEDYKESEYTFYEALTDEDADLDGDGKISVEEAHAFMVASMNNQSPQLSDPDGDDDFVIPEY